MDRREFLFQRKNRCVGRILGELEDVLGGDLPTYLMQDVRRIIKTRISDYHTDVLEAMEFNSFNAIAMKMKDSR